MEIKVLGQRCSKCVATIEMIERVARDVAVRVNITKVEDPRERLQLGATGTPAFIVAGRLVHNGGLPSHVRAPVVDGPADWIRGPVRIGQQDIRCCSNPHMIRNV